jgi:hypothetical protein
MQKLSRLQELVQQRHVIRVTPKHRPHEKLYGIPLTVTDEFILLHEVREFHLDGYLVLPVANVRGVRLKEAEQTAQRILQSEGALANLGLADPVSLSSFRDLFESLHANNMNVSVEACEPAGKWIEDFFLLGRITEVSEKSVRLQPFDATGHWEQTATRVLYKRILSVTFNNEYMNIFSKYLK